MTELRFRDWTIELDRRPIKNIYLRISPHGQINLRVPKRLSEADIQAFLESKATWLQDKLQSLPEIKVQQWQDGAVVPLLGQSYRLRLSDTEKTIRIDGEVIVLPKGEDSEKQHKLNQLYRSILQRYLDSRVSLYAKEMKVEPNEWRIKAMKTRWGSCNPVAKRLWFSLELAKKTPEDIDYVIVHELAHLKERGHNERFYSIVAQVIPGWKKLRSQLNGRLLD